MSRWTVLLSNLRLAPVQVMTQGHPATSMSPEIDYVFLSPMEGDLTLLHSERISMGCRELVRGIHFRTVVTIP